MVFQNCRVEKLKSIKIKNKNLKEQKFKGGNMNSMKKNFIVSIMVMFVFVSFLMGSPNSYNIDQAYQQVIHSGTVYQWDARDITFQNKGMNIVGTLTVPRVSQPCPIILILHGFGGDRHGFHVNGTDEGYFDRLARKLAEQGFGSLRIDFRGSGQSEGTFDMTSFSGQVSDAIAALNYIKTLNYPVKVSKIGLVGHSQGGIVSSLTSAADKRIDSLALWAAPAYPPHDYEGLFLKEGIKAGVALPEGGIGTFPLYVDGAYLFDVNMGKQFFTDLFRADPLGAINHYDKPTMYVSALQDAIVWPQPQVGEAFMIHHNGFEKLVTINSDHNFNYLIGPDQVDETINWTIAWFKETLKY